MWGTAWTAGACGVVAGAPNTKPASCSLIANAPNTKSKFCSLIAKDLGFTRCGEHQHVGRCHGLFHALSNGLGPKADAPGMVKALPGQC